jgi:phenylacetate-CoA ligase
MASECRNTFVEILDDENNVLPYGQEGALWFHCSIKHIPLYAMTLATLGFLAKKHITKPILKKLIGRTNDCSSHLVEKNLGWLLLCH